MKIKIKRGICKGREVLQNKTPSQIIYRDVKQHKVKWVISKNLTVMFR